MVRFGLQIRMVINRGMFVCFLVLMLLNEGVFANDLNVGSLTDTTGATSDVGKDYAMGIQEAIRYVNENGGISGKSIRLFQFDYGYREVEAKTRYRLLKNLSCLAVLGWGTGDTEALTSSVMEDRIPYVSASYSGQLTDPMKTPYNLFAATDYSTNARATLTAWYETRWVLHPEYGRRKPKLSCCYAFSSAYAMAPIAAIKDHALLLGFDIGPDEDIPLSTIDTKETILALKEYKPDVLWHGNTTLSVSATLKDAYEMGLGAEHLTNAFAFDENLPVMAGSGAEGVMAATVCAFYGENVPMMENVMAYGRKYHPSVPVEKRTIHTVQAWANVLALREAMVRADRAGALTGEGILKNGFESMKAFDIGLGGPLLTYTAKDHRVTARVPVHEIRNGRFQKVKEVNLQERWPEEWEKKWIGW